jgi:hypothetical protein
MFGAKDSSCGFASAHGSATRSERCGEVRSALSTRINALRVAIGDSGGEQRLVKTL